MIEKPRKAHYDTSDRTSILFFKDQVQAKYMMRGGMCWPTKVEVSGGVFDVYGFALLAGYNTETGLITVFEQEKFVVIDHIVRPDKSIEYEGLAPWFNRCWSKYFASDFFWNQPDELVKKYLLETVRSEMIKPKPSFISIRWSDLAEAQHVIWKNVKLAKVRFGKGSQLHEELEQARTDEKKMLPAVHALMCCLCGIERFPWRKIA